MVTTAMKLKDAYSKCCLFQFFLGVYTQQWDCWVIWQFSNLRYADDTTLMAESEEELKSLLMKVKKESEKVDLNLSIQKTNIKKKEN